MLEQRLAVLACLAVECTDRNVLEIERHAVAQQEHLRERHEERDHQAAGVPPDLQQFLQGDSLEPTDPHAAALGAAPSAAMSCTNTSSSVGGIRAMWRGRSPFAASSAGKLAQALLRVADQDVQGVAEDRTIAHVRRILQGFERLRRAHRIPAAADSPPIAVRFNSAGLPVAISRP